MKSVYSVSQINAYIKNMFLQDFALNNIYIKGEVSNCKYHSSGHIYFSLKDKGGVIACVMFAGNKNGLKFQMQEGQTVVAIGSVNIYERDGKYQLYAKEIILEGAGLLYQRFEQLKTELKDMGLFDEMYKKPIPKNALKIGICTAKTGAAIQDIISISSRRNPYVQLYLYPAIVQGEAAPKSIVNGIRYLDSINLDIIIIGRGGGSIEDLWAFNEEIVARAIFDCSTPIISAVGHETDTTIADYVADLRAPTPSAAAELAVFDYVEFSQKLSQIRTRMAKQLLKKNELYRMRINQYDTKIKYLSPSNQIQVKKQYLDELQNRIHDSLGKLILGRKHKLAIYAERLGGLSPLNKLSKGFAHVNDAKGNQLISVEQVKQNDEIKLSLTDGSIDAKVINVRKGSVISGK